MLSNEVRQSFLDFFKSKDHLIVSSAPVTPAEDPTILFTNAGMNQFKDIFLGTGTREYKRVANSQKCIRVSGKHNDLKEVGVDTYHHTFFEMLGNWSFGDYYKREAIQWAWGLFTETWKIDKARLYASIYEKDNEAEELWYANTDIISGRVIRLGKKDNFWEMGETGPCGPCSEIHYDLGEKYSCCPDCAMGCECGRFVELWNLVFIQYNRESDGSLIDLPEKHVDTGMGFERVVAVIQNKRSNYDTDLFDALKDAIRSITGIAYEEENGTGVAYRVICDHIRALSFAISDGALPSNDGRGYVLRMILRRAARYSRELNVHEPFMYKLVEPLIDTMGSVYPELKDHASYTVQVIEAEEEGFGKTLDRGIEIFNKLAKTAVESGSQRITGKDAFKLYDTYGFPLDLTELMAREQHINIDLPEFNREMAAQKKRSFSKRSLVDLDKLGKLTIRTKFSYMKASLSTEIARIYDEDGENISESTVGSKVEIQLKNETPFYAESGGQVGDTGTLKTANRETVVTIYDTQKVNNITIFHYGIVDKGTIKINDTVEASVDTVRRLDIRRNHTATHLLHKALREVLGTHVKQAGSLVDPTHLRFDFNHFHKMTVDELQDVEQRVNAVIRSNRPVIAEEDVPYDDAVDRGAMALFGEKYGDRVRTITVEGISVELCGGIHVDTTGNIGEFRIISENAAASGVRRIVAETGNYTYERMRRERHMIGRVKELLNAQDGDIIEKLEQIIKRNTKQEKAIREFRVDRQQSVLEKLMAGAVQSGNPPILTYNFPVELQKMGDTIRRQMPQMEELQKMGDTIRRQMPQGAALISTQSHDKSLLVCVVGDELIKNNKWNAGTIIKDIAKSIGGGGGGRPHMATAGIKGADKHEQAFEVFRDVINNLYS